MVLRDGPRVASDSRPGRNFISRGRQERPCARDKASPRDLQPSFCCKRTQVLTRKLTISVGWSPNVARVVIARTREPSADSTLHNGRVKENTGKYEPFAFRFDVHRFVRMLERKSLSARE